MAVWSVAADAGAVGLSVSPAEVFVDGVVGKPATVRVKVANTSDGIALFEAYPDDLRSAINIFPSSFTLQGGESRDVVVTVTAGRAGRFETAISMVTTPISSEGFRAGAGIKVPLRLNIAEGEQSFLADISSALGTGALPIGVGIIVLILFLKFFKISPRR